MDIQVVVDGELFEREIERLTRVFFDGDCNVHVIASAAHADAGTDVAVRLCIRTTGSVVSVDGKLSSATAHLTAHDSAELPDTAQPVARRQRTRQTVLRVLHELFAQFTGERQPWGILTGIRPLKLVHSMAEQGLTREESRARLTKDYLISAGRADLLLEIADVQREVVPDLYHPNREISVYIGIPFCPTHCAYCTFPAYSMAEKAMYVEDFLQAVELELKHLGGLLNEYQIPVTCVYIGGGTPTSLRAGELERLLDMVRRELPGFGRWREFTVEAGRPDTITPDRVAVMRRYGVDRISVNPQTFKASTLRAIGRGHTPDIVDERFHYVRGAGFENINMDVIVGLPGETLDDVKYTMERIARLDPDSVTVHTLAFKRTAVVNRDRNEFDIPDSDTVRAMVEEAGRWARQLGHRPYYLYRQADILGNMENVGYAKRGRESVYNIYIMEERQAIVGIGGGAVTKLVGGDGSHHGRFANPREPRAYTNSIRDVIARKDERLRAVFETLHAVHT